MTTEPGNLERSGAIAYVLYLAMKFEDVQHLALLRESPPITTFPTLDFLRRPPTIANVEHAQDLALHKPLLSMKFQDLASHEPPIIPVAYFEDAQHLALLRPLPALDLLRDTQELAPLLKSPLRKPCKCGSSSHQRTNHRDCPLNKKKKK